jgi:hypothetical protein
MDKSKYCPHTQDALINIEKKLRQDLAASFLESNQELMTNYLIRANAYVQCLMEFGFTLDENLEMMREIKKTIGIT